MKWVGGMQGELLPDPQIATHVLGVDCDMQERAVGIYERPI